MRDIRRVEADHGHISRLAEAGMRLLNVEVEVIEETEILTQGLNIKMVI